MSFLLYTILLLVAALASVLGGSIGYFYFRARSKERLRNLDALAEELAERENVATEAPAPSRSQSVPSVPSLEPEVKRLRQELEQKNNDYQILQQDFKIEVGVLQDEIAELKTGLSGVSTHERRLERQAREIDLDRQELGKRLDMLQARERALEHAQSELHRAKAVLAHQRQHVLEREAQIDERLLNLPDEHFSSRQEALLIKRLRQQIKEQRAELEQLYALRRRNPSYPEQNRSASHPE